MTSSETGSGGSTQTITVNQFTATPLKYSERVAMREAAIQIVAQAEAQERQETRTEAARAFREAQAAGDGR